MNILSRFAIVVIVIVALSFSSNAFEGASSRYISETAIASRKKSVLILGKDSDTSAKLKINKVAKILESRGYSPLILKDIHDIDDMSLNDKLILHAIMSRFVVIIDDEISGHAYEVAIIDFLRTPSFFLRKKGQGSTFMIADIGSVRKSAEVFQYDDEAMLETVVVKGIDFVENYIRDKKTFLKSLYPWRQALPSNASTN